MRFRLVALVVVCALAGVTEGRAQGPTCTYPDWFTHHTVGGQVNVNAWTVASFTGANANCRTRVETWVNGASNKSCDLGIMEGGACTETSPPDGDGDVYAQQTETSSYVHGNVEMRAKFWAIVKATGSWVANGDSTKNIALFTQQENCQNAGGHWDTYSNSCQFETDPGSPIIVPTGHGRAYKLTSVDDGVLFDLNGDGVLERVAWTDRNSDLAFLAIDRDGDGRITSGRELFGDATIPGVPSGFLALAQLMPQADDDSQGSIDEDDPIFSRLLLWTDRNHNGLSEASELEAAGVKFSRFGLSYWDTHRTDRFGNEFRYRGWAELRTKPGKNRSQSAAEHQARLMNIWDVFFQVRTY